MAEESIAEQKYQAARRIRSILGVVDDFFVEPTKDREELALQQLEQLPERLRSYGELCRKSEKS